MPHRCGRVAIFTAAQETLIVDMVHENNLIRLREIRDKVIADDVNFESIDDVSLATIDRVLRRSGVCVCNITLFAAMGLEGLVHRHAVLGSYNTQRLLTFLEELKDILLPTTPSWARTSHLCDHLGQCTLPQNKPNQRVVHHQQ